MARESKDENTIEWELNSQLRRRVYLLAGSTTGTRGIPSQDKSVVNDRSPSDVVEIDDGDVGVGCHNG